MKTKFLRVFALFASVLVLVTCLIVPMSADSFDSSKPLVESDWQYVTVIEYKDLDRMSDGNVDMVIDYQESCYVLFSVNYNRYSIAASRVYTHSDLLAILARGEVGDFPLIMFNYDNLRLEVLQSSDIVIVDRYFSSVDQFSITIYHNSPTGVLTSYDDNYVSVTTNPVEPSSTRITSVFTNIMDWITSGLNNVQGVFYANNQLTMLGTLAVIGVAVGVAFLIIGVVQKFLKLRS